MTKRPLPKSKHALFETTLPSDDKVKVHYRPMLAGEEKILLMAKTIEDDDAAVAIFRAIKQVVNNCVQSEEFNIDDAAIFDIEWLFIQIRINSVGPETLVVHYDADEDKTYEFTVDLREAKVVFPEGADKVIQVDDDMHVVMKYPSGREYDDKSLVTVSEGEMLDILISRCIDKIYVGEEVFDASEYTQEELVEYINAFTSDVYKKLANFVNRQPAISMRITYTDQTGEERGLELVTLSDFFMLR